MQNSLKGWKFGEWVKGNWSTIKEGIKVGLPLLLGLAFIKDNPSLVVAVTLVGKLVLDLGHYYVKG